MGEPLNADTAEPKKVFHFWLYRYVAFTAQLLCHEPHVTKKEEFVDYLREKQYICIEKVLGGISICYAGLGWIGRVLGIRKVERPKRRSEEGSGEKELEPPTTRRVARRARRPGVPRSDRSGRPQQTMGRTRAASTIKLVAGAWGTLAHVASAI